MTGIDRSTPIALIIAAAVLSPLEIPLPWRIAAIAVIAIGIPPLIKKGSREIQFTHFGESGEAPLRNKMKTWQVIEIVSISGAVLSLACIRFNEWAMLPLLLLVCLSRFARSRHSRHRKATLEIREASGAPGWVRIGGAHPEALAMLRQHQIQRKPTVPSMSGGNPNRAS